MRAKPTFWENVDRGYRFLHRKGFQQHEAFINVEETLTKAEIIHLFGGGYINEYWPKTGFLLGFVAALQGVTGCKLYGTGLGLMPMSDPPSEYRQVFTRILNRFEFLESRDVEGYVQLSRLKPRDGLLVNGIDDSFMSSVGIPARTASRTMHISCFLTGEPLAKLTEDLKRLRARPDWDFERVLFWECAPHRDREAVTAIQQVLPEIVLVELPDLLWEIPVRAGDYMITTRFHPHLLAARAGASGYYLHSGEYYRTKHESVISLGSPFLPFEDLHSRGFIHEEEPSPMQILDKQRVARKGATMARIYGQLAETRNQNGDQGDPSPLKWSAL
jgi:hypothetical protein